MTEAAMTDVVEQIAVVTGYVVGLMLLASALLCVVRIIRGPSVLNRTLASDVLVSTLVCAVGAQAAFARSDSTLPLLTSLALVAFVGSVSVARFVARDTDDDKIIRRPLELP